jgi:membrane protease YdiL (CAAX protease family)
VPWIALTVTPPRSSFTVVAVIGAPLVEELFFRGLLQRAFYPVLGGVGAVSAQALLFGVSHLNPALGSANFTVIAATAAAGVVFGLAARRRRLPTAMVGHAVFNGVVVLVVLAGLAST